MWLSLPRLMAALSPLPVLVACASGGATASNPSVITAPELSRSRSANAYDAIRRIRPEMLRKRDPGSVLLFGARRPAVAVDNTLVGGVEQLQGISLKDVVRIEYVGAWDASKRYGAGFGDGVLLIGTRADSTSELTHRQSASR